MGAPGAGRAEGRGARARAGLGSPRGPGARGALAVLGELEAVVVAEVAVVEGRVGLAEPVVVEAADLQVLDGEKDMAPEGTGSYFCTKGMDHYSNRDLGAKHLAHRTPVPSAAQIVPAHNQNAKLHAYGGGGRRVRWDETVPYHAAPVRDESQFRPEGRLF